MSVATTISACLKRVLIAKAGPRRAEGSREPVDVIRQRSLHSRYAACAGIRERAGNSPALETWPTQVLGGVLDSVDLRSRLQHVSGEKNRCGSAGRTSEPTSTEAQYPCAELRCSAKLVERHTEQDCSQKSGSKADAGI